MHSQPAISSHPVDVVDSRSTTIQDRFIGSCTDEELVTRMAAGEEAALGLLYDRWSPRIFSIAARLLEDVDAEEVVEETFWQAWRQAERYEQQRGTVSGWLATVARSRALDLRRKRFRAQEQISLGVSAAEPAPSPSECPYMLLEMREARDMIFNALKMLPMEQREAVELAYYGGLTQAEISQHTSSPLGTVKTRIRAAMGKLRDHLSMLQDDARS